MVTLHSHATRLGVLDIGSNTVHMLIVDAAPGARPEPEASTKSTIRLMQYLKDDGSIKKAGIEALLSAVEKAMKLAEEYEITQLLVLATSALREAPNGGKILRKIEEAIGQPVTVLSGVDEARLTFLAARRWYGWDAGRLLVIDPGNAVRWSGAMAARRGSQSSSWSIVIIDVSTRPGWRITAPARRARERIVFDVPTACIGCFDLGPAPKAPFA